MTSQTHTHCCPTHLPKLQQQLGERNGAVNGEHAGFATVVTEFAVGITGENFAAITAEELDSGSSVKRRPGHVLYAGAFYFSQRGRREEGR